jgi:hypothetical protein
MKILPAGFTVLDFQFHFSNRSLNYPPSFVDLDDSSSAKIEYSLRGYMNKVNKKSHSSLQNLLQNLHLTSEKRFTTKKLEINFSQHSSMSAFPPEQYLTPKHFVRSNDPSFIKVIIEKTVFHLGETINVKVHNDRHKLSKLAFNCNILLVQKLYLSNDGNTERIVSCKRNPMPSSTSFHIMRLQVPESTLIGK